METLQSELYFKSVETEMELKKCMKLRYQVYCEEKKWLSPTSFPEGYESDEYDKDAIHLMCMNSDFELVATMRLLPKNNFNQLPYTKHPGLWEKYKDIPNAVELSRFVIRSDKNRVQIAKGLFRAVYQQAKFRELLNWIFISEPSMIRYLLRFGYAFDPIGVPAKHFGGFIMPALCNIPKTEESWVRKNPGLLKFHNQEQLIYRIQEDMVA